MAQQEGWASCSHWFSSNPSPTVTCGMAQMDATHTVAWNHNRKTQNVENPQLFKELNLPNICLEENVIYVILVRK